MGPDGSFCGHDIPKLKAPKDKNAHERGKGFVWRCMVLLFPSKRQIVKILALSLSTDKKAGFKNGPTFHPLLGGEGGGEKKSFLINPQLSLFSLSTLSFPSNAVGALKGERERPLFLSLLLFRVQNNRDIRDSAAE